MATIQKITPNLWFDGQAEEAANFYTSIFKNSSIKKITRYGKHGTEVHGQPEGSVMTVEFEIEGQTFVALNGGPHFKFTPAVSFIVNCDNQEEVDYYWDKLSEGGYAEAQQCGWLQDNFGLSWQIIPTILLEYVTSPDAEKAQKAFNAMLKMKKIDIATIEKAVNEA